MLLKIRCKILAAFLMWSSVWWRVVAWINLTGFFLPLFTCNFTVDTTMCVCVHVQFVSDGWLEPHESFRTWRIEETNVDYDAVPVEITILRQIFQVGAFDCRMLLYSCRWCLSLDTGTGVLASERTCIVTPFRVIKGHWFDGQTEPALATVWIVRPCGSLDQC